MCGMGKKSERNGINVSCLGWEDCRMAGMFHVWDGRIAEWQECSMFGMRVGKGGIGGMFYGWS
jgi:hypothetical protein